MWAEFYCGVSTNSRGPAAKNYFLPKQIDHSMLCTLSLDTHSCWALSARRAGGLSTLSKNKYPSFEKWTFSSLVLWLFEQFSLRNGLCLAVISHSFLAEVLTSRGPPRQDEHLWWSHSEDLWIAPESCRCNKWMLSYDSICSFHRLKVSDPHSSAVTGLMCVNRWRRGIWLGSWDSLCWIKWNSELVWAFQIAFEVGTHCFSPISSGGMPLYVGLPEPIRIKRCSETMCKPGHASSPERQAAADGVDGGPGGGAVVLPVPVCEYIWPRCILTSILFKKLLQTNLHTVKATGNAQNANNNIA